MIRLFEIVKLLEPHISDKEKERLIIYLFDSLDDIRIMKKIAKNFRYNTKYNISADLDLILRLIKKKVSYKHLNFFSIVMETGGMSSFQGKFLKKIYEDLNINKKYFKHYFLNFFIQKILKIETFLLHKKNF